jgi:hypothetical protein
MTQSGELTSNNITNTTTTTAITTTTNPGPLYVSTASHLATLVWL